jgi:ATP-dependent Clp protease ATP-binding subunit ClpA
MDPRQALPAIPRCVISKYFTPQMGQRMLREEVTAADIAEVTAKWTGIPVLYTS